MSCLRFACRTNQFRNRQPCGCGSNHSFFSSFSSPSFLFSFPSSFFSFFFSFLFLFFFFFFFFSVFFFFLPDSPSFSSPSSSFFLILDLGQYNRHKKCQFKLQVFHILNGQLPVFCNLDLNEYACGYTRIQCIQKHHPAFSLAKLKTFGRITGKTTRNPPDMNQNSFSPINFNLWEIKKITIQYSKMYSNQLF